MDEPIERKPKNFWMITSSILTVVLVLSLTSGFWIGTITGAIILNPETAGEKAVAYLNDNIVETGEVKLIEVSKSNGMFLVKTSYQGQEINIHVTKDGKKMFVAEPMEIVESAPKATTPRQVPEPMSAPKTDKPKVELFIMRHCPYGTQMEKAAIPVAELLGDNIDFEVKFVYYAMHPSAGEVEEQLKQYCIQKFQNEKFLDYLKAFLEDGDSEAALEKANIDIEKLEADMEKADKEFDITKNLEDKENWLSGRFPLFDIHKSENEKYGIQGSPALVINGEKISVSRSPEAVKIAVCNSFNTAPRECSQELSSDQASPGFGSGTGGSAGSCG